MTYFVVFGSEDGTQVREVKEADISFFLSENGWNDFKSGFGSSFNERDPNYWPEKTCLVIRGEIVVPKPVEVVKEWKV